MLELTLREVGESMAAIRAAHDISVAVPLRRAMQVIRGSKRKAPPDHFRVMVSGQLNRARKRGAKKRRKSDFARLPVCKFLSIAGH